MDVFKKYIELARFPNLLIVVLTVWWPSYWIFQLSSFMGGRPPAFEENAGLEWLTAVIVLSTFSGYIINALFDRDIDLINKPLTASARFFSVRQLWTIYGLGVFGVIISAWQFFRQMGFQENQWAAWLFTGVNAALFFYSWKWKCTPILGNLAVALLCALVPLSVILAAYKGRIPSTISAEWLLLLAVFAFFATLMREIVKDLEDAEGDQKAGCQTFAGAVGSEATKAYVLMLALFEALGFFYFGLVFGDFDAFLAFLLRDWWQLLLIFIPLIIAYLFLQKDNYSKSSLWFKIHIVAGILFVPLFQ